MGGKAEGSRGIGIVRLWGLEVYTLMYIVWIFPPEMDPPKTRYKYSLQDFSNELIGKQVNVTYPGI